MSNKTSKADLQNCSMDLKRVATSFYVNPKGKTWQVFLDHALRVLGEKRQYEKYATEVENLKKKAICAGKDEIKKIADEILTCGILMRS